MYPFLSDYSELLKRIYKIASDLTMKYNENADKINMIQDVIAEIYATIVSQTSQINAINSSLSTLNSQVDSLQTNMTSVNSQLTTINLTLVSLQNQIDNIIVGNASAQEIAWTPVINLDDSFTMTSNLIHRKAYNLAPSIIFFYIEYLVYSFNSRTSNLYISLPFTPNVDYQNIAIIIELYPTLEDAEHSDLTNKMIGNGTAIIRTNDILIQYAYFETEYYYRVRIQGNYHGPPPED